MTNSTLPAERRRYPRTQISMTVQAVVFEPEGGDVVHDMELVDISRGGMGVTTDRPMYPGQRIMLRLPAPGLGVRNVTATIRRCSKADDDYRVGLEFDYPIASMAQDVPLAIASAA